MATQQPIFFFANDTAHQTTTEYVSINSRNRPHATEATVKGSVPTAGTFKKLNVKIDTDPGSGRSYKISLRINAVTSTSLTLTFTGGGALEQSVELNESISAGDQVAIEIDPTGTPTAFTEMQGNLIWQPAVDDEYIIVGGANDKPAANATEYCPLEHSSTSTTWNGTETNRRQLIGASGTLKKFHCALEASPGAGESYVMTIRQNEASPGSGLAVTLDNDDFDKVDTSNTIAVTAGDTISLQAVGSTSATTRRAIWSCVFVPTTAGEIPLLGGNNNDLSNSATEYSTFGSFLNWWTGIGIREIELVGEEISLKAMYIKLNGSPGSGNNYDFDATKDGVAQAGLNVNIADTATTGNATGQAIAIEAGDRLSFESVPTSTPTARDAYWGLVFTYAGGAAGSTARSYVAGVIG